MTAASDNSSRFYTNPELAAAMRKITAHLSAKQDGAMLTWLDLEKDLDIPMRGQHRKGELDGRTLVRRALRKLRRPYETVHGSGLRLSAAATAVNILGRALTKVSNQTSRAQRVHADLQERHLHEMTADDRERMTRAAGLFATIELLRREQVPKILK